MSVGSYQIVYGLAAQEDLDQLPGRVRAQILRKIGRLQAGLHGDIKALRNAEHGFRLRMGDYRVLFDVAGEVIVIGRVGHRKHIYD